MPDVVVIGSGLGGLMSAAMLAQAGKKVTVLERHSIPGGYATSFRRRKYEMEVSLHMIGDLGEGGALRKILQEVGLDSKVEFLEAHSLYQVQFPDLKLIVRGGPAGYAEYVANLFTLFPEEKDGIEALFAEFSQIRSEILLMSEKTNRGEVVDVFLDAPSVLVNQTSTFGQLMNRYVQSERLKSILAQFWSYLSLPPSQVSGVFLAYIWTEYHLYGGYYPSGRSQTISNALRDLIVEHGGEVRTNREVQRILVEDGQAHGVQLKNGEVIEAELVISNANPMHTMREMVGPEHLPKRYLKKIDSIKPSLSCVQAYVVLDLDFAKTYDVQDHEIFINEYYDLDRAYQEVQENCVETMPMCITIYENINPNYQSLGKTTLSIFTISDPTHWFGLSKDEYRLKKQETTEILLARMDERFPGTSAKVEFIELSTPVTNTRYTGNPAGAIYGSQQSVDQSLQRRLPQKTPIAGLYLAGAWTQPGGGYSGVIWSGYNLAKQLLLTKSPSEKEEGESYAAQG